MLRHPLLLAAVAVLLGILIIGKATTLTPSYKDCESDQQASYAEYQQNDLFDQSGSFIYCEGVFAQDNNGSITAAATVFLTMITFALVWLAREQSKTAKSQLRAYVSALPEKCALRPPDNRKMVVMVVLENAGPTPAFRVQCLCDIRLMEYPLQVPLRFYKDPADEGKPIPTYVIFPRAKHGSVCLKYLDGEILAKMDDGKHALYVFGRVTFVDVFGNEQWTEFCSYLDKPAFDDWFAEAKKKPEGPGVIANFKFTETNNRASQN